MESMINFTGEVNIYSNKKIEELKVRVKSDNEKI